MSGHYRRRPNISDTLSTARLEAEIRRQWLAMGRSVGDKDRYEAFAHVFAPALAAYFWPASEVRYRGIERERNSWFGRREWADPRLRRSTFKDAFNNELGISLGGWFRSERRDIAYLARAAASLVDRERAIVFVDEDTRVPALANTPNAQRALPDLAQLLTEAHRAGSSTPIDLPFSVPVRSPNEFNPDEVDTVGRLIIGISQSTFSDASGEAQKPLEDGLDYKVVKEKMRAAAEDAIARGIAVEQWGSIGNMIGSSLGNALGGKNSVAATLGSTAMGTITQNLAQAIAAGGVNKAFISGTGDIVNGVLDDFGAEFMTNLQNSVVGTVSSMLAMELGKMLGVSGFGAELLDTVGASIIAHAANNILAGRSLHAGLSSKGLFEGIDGVTAPGGILPGTIGSFLGSKLGSLILAPTNSEGAVLSSLGSTAGVWALTSGASSLGIGSLALGLTKLFGSLANFGVPFVGSLAGFLIGSLIGSLFGAKKPRLPMASAEIHLDLAHLQWQLGAVTSINNGDRSFVSNMASTAKDGLNSIISMIVGGSDLVHATNTAVPRQKYGHSGSTVYFDELAGSSWLRRYSGPSADTAVEMGLLAGLSQTRIAGGDIILKRVVSGVLPADVSTLMGNLQIAMDFRSYLEHPETINRIIAAAPNSAFAAGWAVTLLRAEELKLNKFAPSDFYGGLPGFASSFGIGGNGSFAYENIGLDFEGVSLRIKARDGAELFDLFAASNNVAAADAAKSVLIPNFNTSAGYTFWSGGATAGNDIALAGLSAAPVTLDDVADGGDDIFAGSAHNDHLYGRSGYDWLDGDSGHDWIEGGGQNDVLLGGAGTDVLIGGDGDDYLAGGDGDDYPAEWRGGLPASGGLHGQAGNDTLVGGEGWDYLNGGDGDDIFLIDQDAQFGWQWDELWGEAGSDTASFERFAGGVAVHMNNGKDGWGRKGTDARRSARRTEAGGAQNRRPPRRAQRWPLQYRRPRFAPRTVVGLPQRQRG